MTKRISLFIVFLMLNLCFGQQNEEFRKVKSYFDSQRQMILNHFEKKMRAEENPFSKIVLKSEFEEFMTKMDSVQNVAFIFTLIQVKTKEDLQKIKNGTQTDIKKWNADGQNMYQSAVYPGGFSELRKQVAEVFYTNNIVTEQKRMSTSVQFVVEPDGSISSVHANGDHYSFNRQAEIALYLLPEKFVPAVRKGEKVRYHFNLPVSWNVE